MNLNFRLTLSLGVFPMRYISLWSAEVPSLSDSAFASLLPKLPLLCASILSSELFIATAGSLLEAYCKYHFGCNVNAFKTDYGIDLKTGVTMQKSWLFYHGEPCERHAREYFQLPTQQRTGYHGPEVTGHRRLSRNGYNNGLSDWLELWCMQYKGKNLNPASRCTVVPH